jgi:hypothetical protein
LITQVFWPSGIVWRLAGETAHRYQSSSII